MDGDKEPREKAEKLRPIFTQMFFWENGGKCLFITVNSHNVSMKV